MKEFIAERRLIARSAKGLGQRLVSVRVGAPYWIDVGIEAACPRQWAGLFDDIADARGIDPLHALQIALDVDATIHILKDEYAFEIIPGEIANGDRLMPGHPKAQKWIAERKIIAESLETGERKEVTIRVGIPFWRPGDDFASCPIEWDGLFENLADAKGIDLLQALQLAADIEPLLEQLRTKYNFYWSSGEGYFDEN